MPHTASQTFLCELDKKLWNAADRLPSNLDAVVYKLAVLGLIFLKYVSDSFAQRQAEIEEQLRDPESDLHLSPADYRTFAKYDEAIAAELEERDYCIEKNVFWVPALRSDDIPVVSRTRVATGVSPLPNLAGLINLIATIPFQHADLHAKDILGHNTNSPQSNSSSASLGDLCAFAVNSLLPRMATGMSPLPDTFTRDQHPDRSLSRQSAAREKKTSVGYRPCKLKPTTVN